MEQFDAFLYIRAPFNLREDQHVDGEKARQRQRALKESQRQYFERTATRALKRNLSNFPPRPAPRKQACRSKNTKNLFLVLAAYMMKTPSKAGLKYANLSNILSIRLNRSKQIHYLGEGIDISFYPGPGMDQLRWPNQYALRRSLYLSRRRFCQRVVHFTHPAIYQGHEVEGVTLWVKEGYLKNGRRAGGRPFWIAFSKWKVPADLAKPLLAPITILTDLLKIFFLMKKSGAPYTWLWGSLISKPVAKISRLYIGI